MSRLVLVLLIVCAGSVQSIDVRDRLAQHKSRAAAITASPSENSVAAASGNGTITVGPKTWSKQTIGGCTWSNGLLKLMNALGDIRTLRTCAKGQGWHGKASGKRCLCAAADISQTGSLPVHQTDPNRSLRQVVWLLRTMPAGRYQIGLPRCPSTKKCDGNCGKCRAGTLGSDRGRPGVGRFPGWERDNSRWNKFLDPKYNECPPAGTAEACLNKIIDPTFKSTLQTEYAAAKARGATVDYFYADAFDHIHISVISGLT